MPRFQQANFTAGVLSQALQARTDLDKRLAGLADAQNVIIKPQGGLMNRAGFAAVAAISGKPGKRGRLIPFEFSVDDTYMLHFEEFEMRVIRNGAYVLDSAVSEPVVDLLYDFGAGEPYFLLSAGSITAPPTLIYLDDPDGTCKLHQQVVRFTSQAPDGGGGTRVYFELNGGETTPVDTFDWGTTGPSAVLRYVYERSMPYTEAQLKEVDFAQDGDFIYMAQEDHDPRRMTRVADDNWTLQPLPVGTTVDTPGNPTATVDTGSPGTDPNPVEHVYVATAVDFETGEESLPTAETAVTNDLGVVGNKNKVLGTTLATNPTDYYYNIYKKRDGVFGYIGRADIITSDTEYEFFDDNILPDITQTPPVARDPFDGADNNPSVVTFFEQRLCFAATKAQPQVVEMSSSVNPLNFNRALIPAASDAISFRVRSQSLNRITALVPTDELLIFTAGNEWRVTGGEQLGYLTPSNPILRPTTKRGTAEFPRPIVVGDVVLHVLGDRGTVRDFVLLRDVPSSDLTILSRDLFRNKSVRAWAYAQSPDSVVWVCMEDGTLLTLTYMIEHDIWGWTPQVLGSRPDKANDGDVLDVAVVREGTRDVVYALVKRFYGDSATYEAVVERLAEREPVSPIEANFTDSGLSFGSAGGATFNEVSGLVSLRGRTVTLVKDGSVEENVVVGGNGVITLDDDYEVVHVGYSPEAYAETCDLVLGVVQELGATAGRFRTIGEVLIDVVRSRGIRVRINSQQYEEVKDYTGFDPIVPFNGIYKLSPEGDWSDEISVRVSQKYPLPMEISRIMMDYELGE